MPAEIIVTADDAGYCDAIDRAITKLARDGPVTRASVFSNYASTEAECGELTAEIPLGLHFNISSGAPISPASQIPTLTGPDGRFHEPRKYITRDFDGEQDIRDAIKTFTEEDFDGYRRQAIRTELEQQLEQFEAVFGHCPEFSSVHHNLGRFPKVWQAMERVESAPKPRMKQLEDGELGEVFSTFVRNTAIKRDAERKFRSMIIDAIESGLDSSSGPFEIVCHPSMGVDGLNDFTVYREGRVTEYHILKSDTIMEIFEQAKRRDDAWLFEDAPGT